ncbi:MAG: AbrB/MazE/SpoVT family DNA-binding domain-containing protein [Balneolaceae bacterium]|jgi:AbrB family looped-hinge helix DNA binding protein|nr:MAG: AbrB/MazE/SpoVT family DNA-binding domain-containing protein [Balneolaceae bacterium]
METVKLSSKYQVVIPSQIRKTLGLKPGQKMQVFPYQNRIEFIPVIKIEDSKGLFKGINTTFEREADRI